VTCRLSSLSGFYHGLCLIGSMSDQVASLSSILCAPVIEEMREYHTAHPQRRKEEALGEGHKSGNVVDGHG
jgi:hypothetical protein